VEAARIFAVAVADVRTRLRRPGTGVLVLASAFGAWLAIPDPATGAGLLHIGGARALYTSPALAFATAAFFAFPLSLFGYYLVSNALERDVRARMATVVAASPVGNAEYLLGKLAGNLALLVAMTLGFMAAAMAMQLVRGEGPLEPATFVAHYVLLLTPAVAWVAAMALLFECAPGLSGRAGDVAYFFVWGTTLTLGAEPWRKTALPASWIGRCLDYTGLGYLIRETSRQVGTSEFTIGYAPIDAAKAPILFPGLHFTAEAVTARAMAFFAPMVLFLLAVVLFRRFDPARTRTIGDADGRSLSALLAAVARPLGRPLLALLDRLSPDAALSFRARPPLVLLAAAFAVLGLALPTQWLREALLPGVFAVLSVALADVATRERQAGLAGIVFATPGRSRGFARWKLATAALVAFLLAGVPSARLLVTEPGAGVSAFVGVMFLAAAAVVLGIATATPKTFMALSLALWYLALNAKGHTPALDYGGWWASATPRVQAGWAAATLLAAALAFVAQRARLARED
jgi:hypothetical protein